MKCLFTATYATFCRTIYIMTLQNFLLVMVIIEFVKVSMQLQNFEKELHFEFLASVRWYVAETFIASIFAIFTSHILNWIPLVLR